MILDNFFEPRKKSIAENLDQPIELLPGLNQTIDSKTGLTTRKYSMGPTNVKQITDPKGKILSTDAEVDYGIGKFAFGQAGGITSKAYTPAPGQEGMSGRDLYSMGNANKAATYDRATAAVNEAPRAPGSPALATPKAPAAPATPALEEDDQSIDKELVKQIYRNNRDVIGPNPNLIQPKTIIDLPDGTPYEIQPGDTLSKIARKIPAIKADAAVSNAFVAPEPSFLDKLKQAASGIAAGQFPSQAIPDAFPSLKKSATAGAAPVVKATPEPVVTPRPVVKAPPEMVSPADSMDPGEEIVVKSKVKPQLPPRTPSPEPFMPPVAQPRFPHVPSPQPFMPAGANPERPKEPHVPTPKEPTILDKAGDKIGQAYHWLADMIKRRESGNDYDRGYHYPPGSGDAGPDKRKSTAWGAYGMTEKYIENARKLDPTLDKPLKQWNAADQDRAFQLGTAANVKRMSTLGVDLTKHPEAPSIAHILGPDGAAEWYKDGTLRADSAARNGGEDQLRAIIAKRTKDAQAALELQNKEKAKQKTKESAVAETVQTVKVMLETATTRDDVRCIKDYIDRQYTRHGLTDPVSFAQRNHLVERVIEITAKRLLQT